MKQVVTAAENPKGVWNGPMAEALAMLGGGGRGWMARMSRCERLLDPACARLQEAVANVSQCSRWIRVSFLWTLIGGRSLFPCLCLFHPIANSPLSSVVSSVNMIERPASMESIYGLNYTAMGKFLNG